MAFYAIWFLGFALCILAVYFLYKNVVSLQDSMTAQKQFRKLHEGSVLATFDQGWIWIDIILAFVSLSFATQASTLAGSTQFAPETLCFIGIAIFCAGKAVSRWNAGRMVFYRQGIFYKTEEIPYSSIKELPAYGKQYELSGKKEKYMISRRQEQEILKQKEEWRNARRSKKQK